MPRTIDLALCVGCAQCHRVCMVQCINLNQDAKSVISYEHCVDCGACQLVCPIKCISENPISR